jgi:hypothetical protein
MGENIEIGQRDMVKLLNCRPCHHDNIQLYMHVKSFVRLDAYKWELWMQDLHLLWVSQDLRREPKAPLSAQELFAESTKNRSRRRYGPRRRTSSPRVSGL